MTVFLDVAPCSLVDVSEVLTACIIRAVSISENAVNFYVTARCNIPEHINLHARRHENLKFHEVREHITFASTYATYGTRNDV
jgi:hypothetical protein